MTTRRQLREKNYPQFRCRAFLARFLFCSTQMHRSTSNLPARACSPVGEKRVFDRSFASNKSAFEAVINAMKEQAKTLRWLASLQVVTLSFFLALGSVLVSTTTCTYPHTHIEWAESGDAEGETSEITLELGDEAFVQQHASPYGPYLGTIARLAIRAMIRIDQIALAVPSPPPEG